MPFPCPNFTNADKLCAEVLHYCDVGFVTFRGWCDCLLSNYKNYCGAGGSDFLKYFANIFSLFIFCLVSCLCFILCKEVCTRRRRDPPPYVLNQVLPSYTETDSKDEAISRT